jgi:diketogulonate reductase-like aldo/keto reductase
MDETFPDIGAMNDEELREVIDEYTQEEREISFRRRILHGKIDILRAELVSRLRANRESGDALISGADVEKLTEILSGRVTGGEDPVA